MKQQCDRCARELPTDNIPKEKTLSKLSKKVGFTVTNATCPACLTTLHACFGKSQFDKRPMNLMAIKRKAAKSIESKQYEQFIECFDLMDMEFLHVEKKIEKQLNVLTELNTARSAVISLRDSLNDSLSSCPDASYIVRRMEANKAISVQATRTAVFSRDGFKCQKCHATKDLSIDHIVSVKNGGGDDLDNLQTLCTRCNSAKGAL